MEISADFESHEPEQYPSLISIPQLSPDLESANQHFVRAVVTLVWPYSASNRSFSLLLAEPDFRLRNKNGQVRVTFCGRCAEEVARTKISIGDTVTLSLKGAQWTENQKVETTPGKSPRWELRFRNQVKLEASRNGNNVAALDYFEPESPLQNALPVEPTTPALLSVHILSPDISEQKWQTPAFLRTKRLRSRSPPPSVQNIFAEEDGYLPGKGRKRPRFSFPSSGWRFLDEDSENPAEDSLGNEENWFDSNEELLDQDSDNGKCDGLAEKSDRAMPITNSFENGASDEARLAEPDKSLNEILTGNGSTREIEGVSPCLEETVESSVPDTKLSLATPRLDPVTSPTLPTPSPLLYAAIDSTTVTQEPSSDVSTLLQTQLSSVQPTDITSHDGHLIDLSDACDTGIAGETEAPELDTQIHDSEHLQLTTLEVLHHGNSVQGVQAHFSLEFTCVNEPRVEHDAEVAAPDAENQDIANEAEEHAEELAFGLAHDDHSDSHSEPMGAYEASFKDGAAGNQVISESESGSGSGSGSEGVVDDDTSTQAHVIEFHDTSPANYTKRSPEFGEASDEEAEDEETDMDVRDSPGESEEDDEEMESADLGNSDAEVESEEAGTDGDVQERPALSTPHRIIHPEVIVLDSDSEDEPGVVNVSSSIRNEGALRDEESLSYQEDDESVEDDEDEIASQDIDHTAGDSDNYSNEEEEEEEEDDENKQNESCHTEPEDLSHGYTMPKHEAHNIDESGDAQAKKADYQEATVEDMDENVSLEVETASRRSDKLKAPEATSDTSSFGNDMIASEEQENSNLPDFEQSMNETNDIDYQADHSPLSEDQQPTPDQSTDSSGVMQPLAYRTVSPLPVSSPPSIINDESQNKHVENDVPASEDHSPSPGSKIVEAKDSHNRRRRWIDGSDERHLQDSSQPLSEEEHLVHELSEGDENTSEKLDEVILVQDHSRRPTEGGSPKTAEVEHFDSQSTPTFPTVEMPKLPVHATLAMLGDGPGEAVDIIAVAVDVSCFESSTAESYMRLHVTDISMAGSTVIVHISRSSETSLPRATEGDVVLLHDFHVRSDKNPIELLSSNDSGWAIISAQADEPHATHLNVTFGDRERGYVKLLQNWYREDGATMAADHMLQLSISQEETQPFSFSAASSDAGSLESTRSGPSSRSRARRKRDNRRVTIHELRDGRRYTEFGWLDSDSIHELRDGTVYAHPFDRDR